MEVQSHLYKAAKIRAWTGVSYWLEDTHENKYREHGKRDANERSPQNWLMNWHNNSTAVYPAQLLNLNSLFTLEQEPAQDDS